MSPPITIEKLPEPNLPTYLGPDMTNSFFIILGYQVAGVTGVVFLGYLIIFCKSKLI
jgi:hypothetical protein